MATAGDNGAGDGGGRAPLPPRVLRVHRVRRAPRGHGALRAARPLAALLVRQPKLIVYFFYKKQ